MSYKKSYQTSSGSKGLYYLIDPKDIALRDSIISSWKKHVSRNAYEIVSPVMVPTEVLEKSGHLSNFGDQIFTIENSDLALRPETATSIFANLKSIRRDLKGMPLRLCCVGRSFRNEKSSRRSEIRKAQFEQMEVEVLDRPNLDFFGVQKIHLDEFFDQIKIKVNFVEVSESEKPHYSKRTVDIVSESGVELGCVNYRGDHDLYTLGEKERSLYNVYEVSLGLDRLVHMLS